MEALFPLPLADADAGATVLKQQRRNSGSPQSKGTTAGSEKVNDKNPGLLLTCSFIEYELELLRAALQNCRAERALFTGLPWEAYCVEAVKYSLSNSLDGFHAACL